MDYLDKDESEEFEKIVINFLLKNKKGSLDDIYATCRDSTPYFLLKDILFHMLKKTYFAENSLRMNRLYIV